MKKLCMCILIFLLTSSLAADNLTQISHFEFESVGDQAKITMQITGQASPRLIYNKDAELIVEFSDATCVPRTMILFDSPLVRRVQLVQFSRTPPVARLILKLMRPVRGKLIPSKYHVRLIITKKDLQDLDGMPGDTLEAEGSGGGVPVPAYTDTASLRLASSNRRYSNSNQSSQPGIRLAQQLINVEMQNTDLRQLLRGLAKQDDIKLIIHDSVKGQVTASLHQVTPIKAIQQILTANGYMYEAVDDYLVAASPQAITDVIPTEWRVIPLENAQATELQGILNGLLSQHGSVQADVRTNSLVLRDIPSNLDKYEQLLRSLDMRLEEDEQYTQTEIFFFKNAKLTEMQQMIGSMLSSDGSLTPNVQSNALVVTDIPAKLDQIRNLVKQFEQSNQAAATMVTRIFRLKYIDANAILTNLQAMLSAEGKISTFVRQETTLPPARQKSTATPYEEGGVAVSHDKEEEPTAKKWSDTLIVTDTLTVLEQIDQLIGELDVLGTQVSIEAQIVELELNTIQRLGIQWEATHHPSGSQIASGPYQQIDGGRLQLGTLSLEAFRDITGVIQALESTGQAKLLAHPRTTTLDNELAQLLVTDRIPVLTLRETQLASTTTYEYLDVGIILTVIPHISENGEIMMEISAQVDSVKEDTQDSSIPPVISSRVTHSRVRVGNGHTLAIGGLIKEENVDRTSGVPVLSRIPLLGAIFRSKETIQRKTDLLILITPKILAGSGSLASAAQTSGNMLR